MHVVAIHTISDPAQFWAVARQVALPTGITLHSTLPNREATKAVCHWEGPSLEAIKDIVEGATGHVSENEYYEVDAENARGL